MKSVNKLLSYIIFISIISKTVIDFCNINHEISNIINFYYRFWLIGIGVFFITWNIYLWKFQSK